MKKAIDIINDYNQNDMISRSDLDLIRKDTDLRKDLCAYFYHSKNRDFAIYLLKYFISLRKDPKYDLPVEDLMLASYILGQHQDVSDCLLIWDAKCIDFDTYCGLDIQLIAFAGLQKAIDHLKIHRTARSLEAIEYIERCLKAGDFDNIEAYFSRNNLPWWV